MSDTHDEHGDHAEQPDRSPRIERRRFLKVLGGVGGAAALGAVAAPFSARSAPPQGGPHAHTGGRKYGMKHRRHGWRSHGGTLTKFVDTLPIPRTIAPVGIVGGVPLFDVNMRPFQQKLHRDLPPTPLWGYDGRFPGPTFQVRRGRPIAVRWRNSLPATHMFQVAPTIHGAEPPTPEVRTVVHLHGAKVLPESDGYPEAWFTNGFAQTGPSFDRQIYYYPNDQRATQLWYHDHALGITRLNQYAGLSGLYLIRDEEEDDLNVPAGRYEVPLMIHDRLVNPDGSLEYPTSDNSDPEVPPFWVPEFFGDTVLVNGAIWPRFAVEPRRYRFRILNASNARFYQLTLNESRWDGERLHAAGPEFIQIGSDGGFLPSPVRAKTLIVAPAERCDVVVDFSGAEGQFFVLSNDAKAPFPDGDDVIPADVMLFEVSQRLRGPDRTAAPARLPAAPPLDPASARATRDLVLLENASALDNPIEGLINTHWTDVVTETPRAGSTEVWRIINTTGDAHPIHVHLVQFQILDRQPFDVTQYPERLAFSGPRVQPPRNERRAPKDTVQAFPGEVTRIVATFDLPAGTPVSPGQAFRYVLHCHILEHEDNDMMRPYDVIG
jgi:spore coat protein A, manganese oxidase